VWVKFSVAGPAESYDIIGALAPSRLIAMPLVVNIEVRGVFNLLSAVTTAELASLDGPSANFAPMRRSE
jgi:hypothetical protein